MRKFLPIILALIAVAGGAFYWFKIRPQNTAPQSKIYGNVEIREAEVSFRQNGRIKTILVDEGDRVEVGQELASLETDTFEDAIAVADAEISVANAEASKLQNGSRREEIALAEAAERQTAAILANAEEDFARQSSLLPSGSVSERVVDAARTARDVAKANHDAAQQTLNLRRAGARREEIASGQGRLQAARASRRRLETALDDTILSAPVAGTIVARTKEVGSLIAPGAPVFTIALSSPVYVRAYVPETALGRVAPGTMVEVRSDSSNTIYQGQVGYVSPRSEFTPKNVETEDLRSDLVYRLRIVIKNPDGRLLQGMPVTVTLPNTNNAN